MQDPPAEWSHDTDAAVGADERARVLAATRGDTQAFGGLVERYQHLGVRVALAFTHDLGLAEDVVQEAFLVAYEHLHRFDPTRPFLPWLLRIIVHRAQTVRRSRLRLLGREWSFDPRRLLRTPSREPQPLDQLLKDEHARELWAAIMRLQPRAREAVMLHYFADLGVDEIAAATGCPGGTIKSRLHHGRRALATLLAHAEVASEIAVTNGANQQYAKPPRAQVKEGVRNDFRP